MLFDKSTTMCDKNDYFNKVNYSKPLEKKYTIKGNYAVSYFEQHSDDKTIKKFQIWNPSELTMSKNNDKKYPLVTMANGTGIHLESDSIEIVNDGKVIIPFSINLPGVAAKTTMLYYSSTVNCTFSEHNKQSYGAQFDIKADNVTSHHINAFNNILNKT